MRGEAGSRNPKDSLRPGPEGSEESRRGGAEKYPKSLRKRRSFLQTAYTSHVSFPLTSAVSLESMDDVCYYDREPYLTLGVPSPTVSSLQDMQGEPGLLETKALGLLVPLRETKNKNPASRVMEMEPETMETKSVVDSRVSSISAIRLRIDSAHKEPPGAAPSTVTLGSSSAGAPCCPNPGPSGPDTVQTRPLPTSPLLQDAQSSTPKGLSVELDDSTSHLSSTHADPDTVCLASSPGLPRVSQRSTQELAGVWLAMESGVLCTNHMQNPTPKHPGPLLSPRDGPEGAGGRLSPQGKMASGSVKEEQQGQLPWESDKRVSNASWSREESGKHLDDPKDAMSHTDPQVPDGGIISLTVALPETGTEQTPSPLPRDPQEQSRDTPKQACQTQEQKLLLELDLEPDFLLGDNVPSASLTAGIGTEPLSHVLGEDTAPQQICFHAGPCPPKPLPCPQGEAHPEPPAESEGHGSGPCLAMEKSFLCFPPESHPEVSASLRVATALGFAGLTEKAARRIGMEQCSCQLSYATCFRGIPQPEMEEEEMDPTACPEAPLTSPPSSTGNRLHLPWKPARAHSCSTAPTALSRKSHIWPEYCSRALRQLKATPASTPEGFIRLLESLLELQDILEASWGVGNKHPPEKCTWHFSESRSRLCMGSQKLLSSCQHVIRMDQSPEEMQGAVRDTFPHLVQLAGLCFQLTDCSRCSGRHREAAGNLRDVVYTYHQFVEAARLTCERGYQDLSVKLLARHCTALTAAVFCLTQKFRASTAL